MEKLETYGRKKTIPEEIKVPVLKTLAHYPDLEDSEIIFRFKKSNAKTIMSAQPIFKSMFKALPHRAYYVNISRTIKLGSKSMKVEDLPEDVLIGWLGHELGHLMDYRERSAFGLIWFGLNYLLSQNYVRGAERKADEYAVRNGLGDMIVKTKNYILNHADISHNYKEKMKRLYLSPEEIMKMVETDQHFNVEPVV